MWSARPAFYACVCALSFWTVPFFLMVECISAHKELSHGDNSEELGVEMNRTERGYGGKTTSGYNCFQLETVLRHLRETPSEFQAVATTIWVYLTPCKISFSLLSTLV